MVVFFTSSANFSQPSLWVWTPRWPSFLSRACTVCSCCASLDSSLVHSLSVSTSLRRFEVFVCSSFTLWRKVCSFLAPHPFSWAARTACFLFSWCSFLFSRLYRFVARMPQMVCWAWFSCCTRVLRWSCRSECFFLSLATFPASRCRLLQWEREVSLRMLFVSFSLASSLFVSSNCLRRVAVVMFAWATARSYLVLLKPMQTWWNRECSKENSYSSVHFVDGCSCWGTCTLLTSCSTWKSAVGLTVSLHWLGLTVSLHWLGLTVSLHWLQEIQVLFDIWTVADSLSSGKA